MSAAAQAPKDLADVQDAQVCTAINETPFLLIPVGYPAEGAEVSDLKRKPLEEILVRVEC